MRAVFILFFVLASGFSTGCGKKLNTRRDPLGPTMMDILREREEFSTLVQAIERAELVPTFSSQNSTLTLLAPSNEAFELFFSEQAISAEELLDDPALPQILRYHTLTRKIFSDEAQELAADSVDIPSLEGREIDLRIVGSDITLSNTLMGFNRSVIREVDEEVRGGVVHTIDRVLIPPEDLFNMMRSRPELTRFVEAVIDGVVKHIFKTATNKTVFAPTNTAIDKVSAGDFDSILITYFEGDLGNVVLYHSINQSLPRSLIISGSNYPSAYDAKLLDFTITGGNLFLNGDQARVLESDIEATNGSFLHIIDGVIDPR
jgi:transforming growth factor-beta-induced protein